MSYNCRVTKFNQPSKDSTYLLNSLLSRLWPAILHVAKSTRLVAFLDRDSGGDDLTKLLERLMQLLVRPLVAEAFHKDVALGLHAPQQVLVVGQRSASLAVQLRELDLLEKLACVKDIAEAGKRVVKVLHLGSAKLTIR